MRLSGKLTAEEFITTRRIVWAQYYWLNLFNSYVQGRLLWIMAVVCIATIIAMSIMPKSANSPAAAFCFGSLAAILLAVLVYRSQIPNASKLRKLNKEMPVCIDVDDASVRVLSESGILTTIPWQTLLGWKMRDSIAALAFPQSSQAVILSCGSLTEHEHSELLAVLVRNLGTELVSWPRWRGVFRGWSDGSK